jgi:hypothetical protein
MTNWHSRTLWSLVCCLVVCSGIIVVTAKERTWQIGHWRDSQLESQNGGAVSIPIGGTAPTTVAGVTIQGTAPTYISIPVTGTVQIVTVEGPDNMVYVASRAVGRAWPVIVNDEIIFAVEGDRLYTKGNGADPKKEFWFGIVKRVRNQK